MRKTDGIGAAEMGQQLMKAINEQLEQLTKMNIIVIGKSGVGKSTLINSVFREDFAETGLGRPVTSEIRRIEKKDYPLVIYDTPGFELAREQQKQVKEQILDLIRKGAESGDINQAIHCIWYCVNVGANRTFDETEIQWLKELTEGNKAVRVPIIIVLTQGFPRKKAEEMKKLVERENLDVEKVIPVLAKDMELDDDQVAPAYGLDVLTDVMAEIFPNELQKTLQNIQKVSLESKRKAARGIVATAVAASTGEGFVPFPFADAALMIPTEVSMIAGITAVYGIETGKKFLTAFVSATLGSAGATVLGKTTVSALLKLIPGVGSVAGGLISGATAGLLTTALGEAYIKIMEKIFTGEMDKNELHTKKGRTVMSEMFKEELKRSKS